MMDHSGNLLIFRNIRRCGKRCVADGLKSGVLTVMTDLKRRMTAVLLAHISKPGHRKDCPVLIHVQLERLILTLGDIDGTVSHIQSTDAASGKHTEPVHKVMGHKSVFTCKVRRRRGQSDTVFKIDSVDTDRLKYIGIF